MGNRRPAEFTGWPPTLPVMYGPYAAVMRRHVDGDTFDVLIDAGFNIYPYRTIRLLADYTDAEGDGGLVGVDAPESNRRETAAAGRAAREWVAAMVPVGTPLILTTWADPDSFGRYLAAVRTPALPDLGRAMVTAGHAVRRTYAVQRNGGWIE